MTLLPIVVVTARFRTRLAICEFGLGTHANTANRTASSTIIYAAVTPKWSVFVGDIFPAVENTNSITALSNEHERWWICAKAIKQSGKRIIPIRS